MVKDSLTISDCLKIIISSDISMTWGKKMFSNGVHACMHAQMCLTLCGFMDCSPRGSSVHGILQARILEWVAISSIRESLQPKD